MLDRSIYQLLENLAPILLVWVTMFLIITIAKIIRSVATKSDLKPMSSMLSELPGLPLTLLHTVCFVKALSSHDFISALIFLWWGPGFILTAGIVIAGKISNWKFNWAPFGLITSYVCKINYLVFMAIYYFYGMYMIMFTFSAWIILDQINLAWFSNNADRTRRTFEDYWLFRVLYVGLLFLPVVVLNMNYRAPLIVMAITLFILWVCALIRVYNRGLFFVRPQCKAFLRNIVYLSSRVI